MAETLLFNILHHEEPVAFMKEAFRVLKPNGLMAVIYWNYDPATPRVPAMEISPARSSASPGAGRRVSFSMNKTVTTCRRTTTVYSSGSRPEAHHDLS